MVNYTILPQPLSAPQSSAAPQPLSVSHVNEIPEPPELEAENFSLEQNNASRMIWCTCCEKNQKHYFARVARWYEQIRQFGIPGECYVFIDGAIVEAPPVIPVHFVEQPFLGRISTSVFPGWKRSFGEAMRRSLAYDLCLHIESDLQIRNREKLFRFLNRHGSFGTWDARYRMIEPSLMILNDKKARRCFAAAYQKKEDYFESELFENRLQALIPWNFAFKGFRLEGVPANHPQLQNFDCFGQAF